MLSDHDIRDLADHMRRAGIRTLDLVQPGQRLRLQVRSAGAAPVKAEDVAANEPVIVRSGTMGIFRRCHPDGTFAAVEVDAVIEASQILGFLQIGLLLQPVIAEDLCVISRILASDGDLAGYGTPLFEVRGETTTPAT